MCKSRGKEFLLKVGITSFVTCPHCVFSCFQCWGVGEKNFITELLLPSGEFVFVAEQSQKGEECDSVVEHMPSMREALGLVPSTERNLHLNNACRQLTRDACHTQTCVTLFIVKEKAHSM